MSFYELQGPTAWAAPPSAWSSTSLDEVEACPRRWQLLRSRWGQFERFPVRPHPAAVEGRIVHEALDRLTRACGQRGNPAFGSAEFSAALTDADFFPGFAKAVTEWHQRLMEHPRPGPGFRLRVSAEELANRAVRMFRESYKPDSETELPSADCVSEAPSDTERVLSVTRALSEVKIRHPRLPFMGVLDRVQQTSAGIEVVDFKTGVPTSKHRNQLLRYAMLWWRKTGDVPVLVRAQYLDDVASWPVTQGEVEDVEAVLTETLPLLSESLRAQPAPARPGVACHTCAVRARCSDGWTFCKDAAVASERGDAELLVKARTGEHGFLAVSRSGTEIAVVYEAAVGTLLPKQVEGQVLRILDGVWRDRNKVFELKVWTEMFLVA